MTHVSERASESIVYSSSRENTHFKLGHYQFRGLHHPKLHPARLSDHVLIPGRIPDELDFGFVDAVDREDFALRIVRPIPQPGAVRVIFTSIFTPPSGRCVSWQS
jgi:hypothetical protein